MYSTEYEDSRTAGRLARSLHLRLTRGWDRDDAARATVSKVAVLYSTRTAFGRESLDPFPQSIATHQTTSTLAATRAALCCCHLAILELLLTVSTRAEPEKWDRRSPTGKQCKKLHLQAPMKRCRRTILTITSLASGSQSCPGYQPRVSVAVQLSRKSSLTPK